MPSLLELPQLVEEEEAHDENPVEAQHMDEEEEKKEEEESD